MMNKRLLSVLCCPVTHKGLSVVRADQLKKVNTAISAGGLANRDGAILSESLKEALVTDDGKIMYPINDGIPLLLEGASVALSQLD